MLRPDLISEHFAMLRGTLALHALVASDFLQEHQEMDGNLQLVQQATRLDAARKLLLAAVAHSRHHFDKEERIVFPLAETMLNSKTLNSLGQSWMEQRTRVAV